MLVGTRDYWFLLSAMGIRDDKREDASIQQGREKKRDNKARKGYSKKEKKENHRVD